MTRYNPRTGQPETYQPGPYDQAHYYFQVGGAMPNHFESWSNGFRFAIPSGTGDGTLTGAQVTAYKAAFQTFYASSIISGGVTLEWFKYARIETDGKMLPGTSATLSAYPVNIGGTGPVSDKPFQNTIAVTWRTNKARGLAHKGRFYLPLPSLASDAGTGMITAASADTVRDKANTLLAALNAVGPYYLAIFSRKAGSPTHQTVVGSAVGRVWDTQRRRRRSLVEDYHQ